MNWKFILKWVVAFTICTIVYNLTGRFWMSLGVIILILVGWNLLTDWIEKLKDRRPSA